LNPKVNWQFVPLGQSRKQLGRSAFFGQAASELPAEPGQSPVDIQVTENFLLKKIALEIKYHSIIIDLDNSTRN
jgi:hypothetical protein